MSSIKTLYASSRKPKGLYNALLQSCYRSVSTTAGSSSNPYPYPTHHHPTPHQIFHLPARATQKDIKARYYDLVRIYHPDSPVTRASRVSPDVAQMRFQSISAAYDVLRGKKNTMAISQDDDMAPKPSGVAAHLLRKRAPRPIFDAQPKDERWKDWLIFGGIVISFSAVVIQASATRQQVISDMTKTRRHVAGTRHNEANDIGRLTASTEQE